MAIAFDGVNANNLDMLAGRDFMRNVSGGAFTAWVTYGSINISRAIIGFWGGVGTATRAKLSTLVGNTVQLRATALDTDAQSTFNTTTTLTTGQRYHIAGIFDFSKKTGAIYINGLLDTVGIFTNMTAGNTSNTASNGGSIGVNEAGNNNPWVGDIEDIRIYGRILGPDEVATIYACKGCDNIVDGLQSRWPLNEAGPGELVVAARDLSSNGYTCPVSGTLRYSSGVTSLGRRRQIIGSR